MCLKKILILFCSLNLLLSCSPDSPNTISSGIPTQPSLWEVNKDEISKGKNTIAILGATLIDGQGGDPVQNSAILIEGNQIEWVGKAEQLDIPDGAEVLDAKGMFLMPGLIDAHFHLDNHSQLPALFLTKGITSLRDPGAWIETYLPARSSGQAIPRLFLTGPHLDMFPPAYPNNSFLLGDPGEGRVAVNKFVDQGASAIKVYFRLSLDIIEEVCITAHERGIPVTAHLEITHAGEAIKAGLDGIEHVTSYGPALLPLREAEKYKQSILADNNARRRGRYEVWNALDLENNPLVDSLLQVIVDHNTFTCPTLAAFEKQYDRGDSTEVNGFQKMLTFTGMIKKAGGRIAVGSHTWAAYSEWGTAYAREMELLSQAGLSNQEIIKAATIDNAHFFRIEERLGSIEKGKIADLLILKENPLENISAIRKVERVMLNGVWVGEFKK